MNDGKILKLLLACGVGFVSGFCLSKRYHESKYYDTIDDIYNECYRKAKEELTGQKLVQEVKDELDNRKQNAVPFTKFVDKTLNEAYTTPYKAYDKPDLNKLHHDRIEVEQEEKEMSDEEYFGDDSMAEDPGIESEIDNVTEDSNGAVTRFITEKEFSETCLHFTKTDIFYYTLDNIFTDEDDQILGSEHGIFDIIMPDIRSDHNPTTFYVRNYNLNTDFQVYVLPQNYHEIAFETAKERERRLSRRRMRDGKREKQYGRSHLSTL